jgi:hypothetical protein
VEDPADEPTAEFVASFAQGDRPSREAIRARVTAEDQATLLVFAQRFAFAALRRNDPALVTAAATAASLVTEEAMRGDHVIWTVVEFICYARRRVGGLETLDGLLDGADPTVGQAFAAFRDTDDRHQFRAETTLAGLVVLQDEWLSYAPTVDLMAMAYRVADILEADRYHVESIAIACEYLVYAFDDDAEHVAAEAVAAADRQVAAVSLESILDDGPYEPLRAYLIELASEEDAATVASAADRRDWPDELQLAVAVGRVCAVLRIDYRSDRDEFVETLTGLERFRPGLLGAIF